MQNFVQFLSRHISMFCLVSYLTLLTAMGYSSLNLNTESMMLVSCLTALTCYLSASHLLGFKKSSTFLLIAIATGFFAEYCGENYGWFFGDYDFTDALGPKVIGVPFVIPLMWFSLTYMTFVLANILLHRMPRLPSNSTWADRLSLAALGAMLVTAYDLAADPYMVYVVKGWIMQKTDGWWFGETLQGFFGWFVIAFFILLLASWPSKTVPANPLASFGKKHVLIPVSLYASWMVFQMMYGHPVETRTISFFAMGTPLLIAGLSFKSWSWNEKTGVR